jgi:hypothetical protein
LAILDKAQEAGRVLAGMFGFNARARKLDDVETFEHFVSARSAFVAQKKLYGYLKTRMGTRYPSMFEDDQFIASINIAKAHIFAACLSDMTIFAVADVGAQGRLSREQKNMLAHRCYESSLRGNAEQLAHAGAEQDWRTAFGARVDGIHWDNVAAGADVFDTNPTTLIK